MGFFWNNTHSDWQHKEFRKLCESEADLYIKCLHLTAENWKLKSKLEAITEKYESKKE